MIQPAGPKESAICSSPCSWIPKPSALPGPGGVRVAVHGHVAYRGRRRPDSSARHGDRRRTQHPQCGLPAAWARYDVREAVHGTKLFRHPELGDLTLTWDTCPLPGSPGPVREAVDEVGNRRTMPCLSSRSIIDVAVEASHCKRSARRPAVISRPRLSLHSASVWVSVRPASRANSSNSACTWVADREQVVVKLFVQLPVIHDPPPHAIKIGNPHTAATDRPVDGYEDLYRPERPGGGQRGAIPPGCRVIERLAR